MSLSSSSRIPIIPPARVGFGERFHIVGELGKGGMGTVYEVFDRKIGVPVALKSLHRRDARSILRFKNEFRSLADVMHPNLVRLHELFHQNGHWFFTMDLVRGMHLDTWLARHPGTLSDVFRQLVAGVAGLHSAGLLHRDLKPSNVLVRANATLAIVDFGLVATQGRYVPADTHRPGTPKYMSPERLFALDTGPSSDWYSLGVMLREALPNGAHPQLSGLAAKLVDFDCEMRPTRDQILSVFGSPPSTATIPPQDRRVFIGRLAPLDTLQRNQREVADGNTRSTFVEGGTGIGKTALVHRFVDRSCTDEIVFEGRCCPQETVPFKAFDMVVDALTRHLRKMDRTLVASLLPPNMRTAVQAFPTLQQLRFPPLADPDGEGDAVETVAKLIAAVARHTPVVIFVDDLQWADRRSAALWTAIEDTGAPIHLVGTFRIGECPPAFLDVVDRGTRLKLGPLSPQEALALAHTQLPEQAEVQEAIEGAEGNPHLLFRMIDVLEADTLARPSIQDLVTHQVLELPPDARALLALIAIAAAPTRRWILKLALPIADFAGTLQLLGIQRLVTVRSGRVACSDERFRLAVACACSPRVVRRLHSVLAQSLAAHPHPEPNRIAAHWLEANAPKKAALWAEFAAISAAAEGAHDRAAQWYEVALRNPSLDRAHRHALLIRRADMSARAGRGDVAARCLIQATEMNANRARAWTGAIWLWLTRWSVRRAASYIPQTRH